MRGRIWFPSLTMARPPRLRHRLTLRGDHFFASLRRKSIARSAPRCDVNLRGVSMRQRRTKKAIRKVDRLLGHNRDKGPGEYAESFEWTHTIEHPAKGEGKTPKKPRLPRTRE